jgi:hypothetical protein
MQFPSKNVWLAFFVHTLLIVASYFLTDLLPIHPPTGFIDQAISPLPPSIEKLIRWDAHWYTFIAGQGYNEKSIVFFPILIILINFLSHLGLPLATAGFLLCNLFAFLSFWIMDLTFSLDYSEKTVLYSLLSYAVMPTSFFLNSIYTEPLFITFSLASVYFARRDRWWYAGISSALTTLTRNLGVFLLLFFLCEFFKKQPSPRKNFSKIIPLFFPPIALVLFMIYNQYLLGNPLAFVTTQQNWGRHFEFPWNNLWGNIPLTFTSNFYNQPGAGLDSFTVTITAFGLLYLTFSPRSSIRTSYLLLGWLWFLIPLSSTAPGLPLYSMSRFVLPVFPLYLLFGQLPKSLFYSYLCISTFSLVICSALFMNWYWLG